MGEAVKKLTGRRVFLYLFLFFAVITVVNVIFIAKALETNTGVVTDSPYERGLNYNKILEAHEKQLALGWKGEASAEDGKLVYRLLDKARKPLSGAKVLIQMVRPVQSGYDFSLALIEEKPGWYAAKLETPLKGAWEARISVRRGENTYDDMAPLVLQ